MRRGSVRAVLMVSDACCRMMHIVRQDEHDVNPTCYRPWTASSARGSCQDLDGTRRLCGVGRMVILSKILRMRRGPPVIPVPSSQCGAEREPVTSLGAS